MALARRIADKLKQKRQYRDAAQVLSQYANDTEEAIVVLLEGGAWADALCMVSNVVHFSWRSKIVSSVSPPIPVHQLCKAYYHFSTMLNHYTSLLGKTLF